MNKVTRDFMYDCLKNRTPVITESGEKVILFKSVDSEFGTTFYGQIFDTQGIGFKRSPVCEWNECGYLVQYGERDMEHQNSANWTNILYNRLQIVGLWEGPEMNKETQQPAHRHGVITSSTPTNFLPIYTVCDLMTERADYQRDPFVDDGKAASLSYANGTPPMSKYERQNMTVSYGQSYKSYTDPTKKEPLKAQEAQVTYKLPDLQDLIRSTRPQVFKWRAYRGE